VGLKLVSSREESRRDAFHEWQRRGVTSLAGVVAVKIVYGGV